MNWQQEGREIGVTLDTCHAVVVVGTDVVATADVALGIAREQAQHRRVAVADMFGDAPPLMALVVTDDPHGLVDSFLFGVSLNRIAYQVPDAGELFVMPSGTGPLDYEELFVHPRWKKLASGFREVGALLVIAAPAGAAHVRELVEMMDGAVLVGDEVPPDLPVAQSLAWVRPRRNASMAMAGTLPPAQSVPAGVMPSAPARVAGGRRITGPVAGLVLAGLLLAATLWSFSRPFASTRRARRGVAATSPAAAAVTGGALVADSQARAQREASERDSAARMSSAPPNDSFPVLTPANAADSLRAARFALQLEKTSTKAGAILDLGRSYRTVPAGTFSVEPRSRFFLVVAGAYATRAGADSLLSELVRTKRVPLGAVAVVTAPYAFLVEADVAEENTKARIARFVALGLPVYALRQANGAANLYFGAFDSPQQASYAVPWIRQAKLSPTLVYRIGRVF